MAILPGDKVSGLAPLIAAESDGAEPEVAPIGVPAGVPGFKIAV